MPSVSNGAKTKYDVIVIGGGHNGLTNAAYLARAGKKVLVLERRHVLGGAAVTEEVFSGFKFSVCSYVVSLLRPEIIRDLDLPRHGLEILPLDGTFTPMPNGDYLWRVNDHGKTHREIARHSKIDAEAYEEFGKAMQAMCRFVKPILSMVPPDPSTLNPRELMKMLFIGKRFQGMSSEDKYNQVQLMTMSAIDFLDQWFETDVLRASVAHFLVCARPERPTSCCTITWERLTVRFDHGDFRAVAPAPSPTLLPTQRVNLARRYAQKRRLQRSSLKTTARRVWCCKMALRFLAM
jgi:phytoene dehydrogenase-like protein